MVVPVREAVAGGEPVLLDEGAEAGDGPVGRVQEELGQAAQLQRRVPAASIL